MTSLTTMITNGPLSRCSIRQRSISWLIILLLTMTGQSLAEIIDVDVWAVSGYGPDDVTIHPGDTVRWTWRGTLTHTVTSGADITYDGLYNSGNHVAPYEFSYTFQNVGTYYYFCIPH